jgi:serine/threonine protein kinase
MEFLQDAAEDKNERYRRIARIGEGTFGDVSLAMDTFTGAQVAVKTVRIIQRERVGIPRAVFRELEALRQLQSCKGHVVDLLDYYPDETNLCLVFEFLPTNLADIIENAEHYLPAQHFKAFSWMLFDALSYCHGLHIIHRDIKPQSECPD